MEWELIMSELIVDRHDNGVTFFEAYLASNGDYPARTYAYGSNFLMRMEILLK